MRSLRFGLGAAVLAAPLAALVVMLRVGGALDPVWAAPHEHFYIVSTCTLLSAVIGTSLALSVRSVRTTRTVFLALGFIGVAMVFATHGLSTPGMIMPANKFPYGVVISAGLSELVGASFIFLSVLPMRWPGARAIRDHGEAIMVGAFFLLLAYVGISMWRPETWEFVPIGNGWDTALASTTIAMLAFAGWRYYRAWRLTELPGQLAMVAAVAFLAESQVSMYYGTLWYASWWMYHVLMLAAFLVLIAGWAVEAVRAKSLVAFSRALELRDSLDHVDLANPETLEALEAAVEAKDSYTRHHMGRVAEYAVAIGKELGLDASSLRIVETAGRIHDVGKITVPDAVLLKPGRLSPQEFEQMKHHAARGEHIAKSSAVLTPVARAIRAHHERYEGNGYPDGLRGEAIPFEARIIAVADTFDALTSTRVYRPMRPWSEAVAELERVAGTQLDPICVDAFVRYLTRTGQLETAAQEAA